MDIDIVFLKKDESPIMNGRTYSVKMATLPRVGENVLFDYIEEDRLYNEVYDILQSEVKGSILTVHGITHNCAVNKESQTVATLFLKPM